MKGIIIQYLFWFLIGVSLIVMPFVLHKEYQSQQRTNEFIRRVNSQTPQLVSDFMAKECDKVRAERDSLQMVINKLQTK